MITTKLFIICAVLGKSLSHTDPCDASIELHSISGRSPLSSATIPCDAYLTERWYLTPRYDMITYDPGLNSCGSIFPIYLQGTLPNDTEIHDITACMVSPGGGCVETFIVQVKNCGDDRAYFLSPTSTCSSTYCFNATRDQDPAPSWTASTVSVLPDVDFDTDTYYPKYYFTCSFTPASETLLYRITWFVHSAKIKDSGYLPGSDIVSLGSLNQTDLTDQGYKLNIMISCGVVAAKSVKGLPGNYTHSPEFYAGIRVLNHTISIETGGNSTVYLKPTIPIPCPGYINVPYCYYDIWMFENYNDYECQGKNIADNQRCGVKLKGAKKTEATTTWFQTRKWETEIPMLVKHKVALVYDNQRVFTLQLRVSDLDYNHLLKETVLDEVKVNVIPTTVQMWKNKVCFGVADPHMRTFDGNQYEMHMHGSFLMYRHTELGITVQARTTRCWRDNIYCFCGIIINSGRDVFMVNICPDYGVKYDGFLKCDDGLLKTSNSGSEYQIFLPTGTIVKLRLLWQNFMNVYIYPSVLDLYKTEGLCGTFDEDIKNDFQLRNGGYQAGQFNFPTPYMSTYANDFSSSWKLESSEDLFPHDGVIDNYDPLIPMSNLIQFCYCEFNNAEYDGKDQTFNHTEATCDYRRYADCIDTRGRPLTCDHHRSKRSLQRMYEYSTEPDLNKLVRKKKSAVTYTRAMAYDLCFRRFQESKIIQLCTEADVIDDSSLNLCVADLMITSDVAWIDEQIESARLQCVHAVDFNKTLQRELTNVTDAIKSISCQNSCSGQGICVNGTCVCNDSYDEIDCSVNKAEPPEIYNSSHQFIHGTTQSYSCDRSTDNCQEIELFGQGFVYDSPPVIRIRKYKITTEYTLELVNQYTKSCIWRGKFVTTCDLGTEDIPSDVFGSHYKYEISNDGINFGSELTLDVFQTTCQEITQGTTGITYKIKDNYCLINGICYVNNAKDPSTSCNVCKSKEEKFKWSTSTEDTCSTETYPYESNDALVIGVSIVGALIAVATVAGVVIACKSMSRKPVTPHGKSANATYVTTLPTPPMPTSSKLPPLSRSSIAHLFEPTTDYMHTTAFQEFQHGADNRPVSRPTSATSIRVEAF